MKKWLPKIHTKYTLISMNKSFYHAAHSNRCSVPAPSVGFGAGEWMAIAGRSSGEGGDRRGRSAAGPGQNITSVGSEQLTVNGNRPLSPLTCQLVTRGHTCLG